MRPYQGQRLSLLTQHGKEQVIKPVLDQWYGSEVVHTQAFDTDTLGTFTRDVERSGTQLDAARKKARIGTALTGLKMGLASEGSFSSDPCTGMFSWNYELVILVDEVRQLELHWVQSAPCMALNACVNHWEQALEFAQRHCLPNARG